MAAALAFQLQRLEAMRDAAGKLMALPQLGRDFFVRGAAEPIPVVRTPVYSVKLYDLLRAYGAIANRRQGGTLRIAPTEIYSMDDALQRLGEMLGRSIDWQTLTSFLPPELTDGIRGRSALASTFAATLEVVRSGRAEVRQDGMFGPIYVRPRQVMKE
jgi:segregation and condensation protein A